MIAIATLTHLITFICFAIMLYQYNKKRKELRETIKKDEEYINSIRSELTVPLCPRNWLARITSQPRWN